MWPSVQHTYTLGLNNKHGGNMLKHVICTFDEIMHPCANINDQKMNKVVMYGIRNYSTVNSKFTHHDHNKNTHHSQPRSQPSQCYLDSSLPGQNGRRFADDVFRCILVNEMFCISIKISLKFICEDPIGNNPALIQIMAWRRKGDKPLSEPKLIRFTDTYMRH